MEELDKVIKNYSDILGSDILKEKRIINVSFCKNGKGNLSARISLPLKYLKELKINEQERRVKMSLENNKIIIEKEV